MGISSSSLGTCSMGSNRRSVMSTHTKPLFHIHGLLLLTPSLLCCCSCTEFFTCSVICLSVCLSVSISLHTLFHTHTHTHTHTHSFSPYQTNLASRAKPGGMGSGGKRRSPLGAAINSRSSPHSHPPVQDELYISDDELDL